MEVLNSPALVLNKNWQALDTVTVRNAIIDVIGERAKFLCPDSYQVYDMNDWMQLDPGNDYIQAARQKIKLPEVIIFPNYSRIQERKMYFSRKNLWKRDHGRCQYCGSQDDITIDHVLPRSRGGTSTFTNCVLCCLKCNTRKGGRTPEEASMKLRRYAVKDGKPSIEYYTAPKPLRWSPLYRLPPGSYPKSWKQFLQSKNDELYWNVELDP
jgi:5-methylcytosine-specific restriction endonuclease McrA